MWMDNEDYSNWPQERFDALFSQLFGSDYTSAAQAAAICEVEAADDIYSQCEDKTYIAKDMLKSIGIDVYE
jgi:hypothetical protein